MSGLLKAASQIAELGMQADVHGKIRMSITFDNPADRERFKAECKRQIEPLGLHIAYSNPLDLGSFTLSGVEVRII